MNDEQFRLLLANTRLLVLIGEFLNSRPEMLEAIHEGNAAIKWGMRNIPHEPDSAPDGGAEHG